MPDHKYESSSSESDDEGWVDETVDDAEEEQVVISLLDDRVFPDAMSMLAYCKDEHQFDFIGIRNKLKLDFYGSVKLINFSKSFCSTKNLIAAVRQRVQDGLSIPPDISRDDIDGEEYLKPVLNDDSLIVCLDSLPQPELDQAGKARVTELDGFMDVGDRTNHGALPSNLELKNDELHSQMGALMKQFENYRIAVQRTLDQRWGIDEEHTQSSSEAQLATDGEEAVSSTRDYYFESYSYNDIHETMLKDTVRTVAYRDFIYGNKHLFAGKTVLDVGCGTGILSMFCAKAGAKLVVAVDRSDIIDKARENIFNNGLGGQITCLKGRIEEIKLPVDNVDIIVSEWMGYALLYEAMLPSVIFARDNYLKPDGLLVPSHASLWIAPVCDSEHVCETVTFWRDVYGFDMKAMQEGIYDEVQVLVMPKTSVCGSSYMFKHLDLHTATVGDLVFKAEWKTTLSPDAESLDGFIVWFDMFFDVSRGSSISPAYLTAQEWVAEDESRVAFSTGPFSPATHWKQCLLLSKLHSQPFEHTEGHEYSGIISYTIPVDRPRGLLLDVKWSSAATHFSEKKLPNRQSWALR